MDEPGHKEFLAPDRLKIHLGDVCLETINKRQRHGCPLDPTLDCCGALPVLSDMQY